MIILKRKTGWIAAAVILLVVILAGLWTVRPRSWTELVGTDDVDTISGSLTESHFRPSEEWETTPPWDNWKLGEIDGGAEVSDLILSALKESSYRANLGNLRNYTPFPRTILHGKGSDMIHLNLRYHTVTVMLDIDSGGQVGVYTSNGIAAYQADDALYGALADIIRAHGTFQEN